MVIGVIGAFDEEVEKFIEIFKLVKEEEKIWNIYSGDLEDKHLVVCRSGIGKVNSGAMTQYLIDHPVVLEEMAQNAKRIVERLSIKEIGDRYLNFLLGHEK